MHTRQPNKRSLSLVTPPAVEPVTVAEARAQSKIFDTDEDPLLEGYITAARNHLEAVLRRQFITATWQLNLDQFPQNDGEIKIPKPPLQSVSSINYVDIDGITQPLASSEFTVDSPDSEPGRIVPAFNKSWPSTQGHIKDVAIEFVAGYGDPADVPRAIRQQIVLLVAHWFEHREAAIERPPLQEMPLGIQALSWSTRNLEFV